MAARTLFHSSSLPAGRTGTTLEVTPRRAGWKYISFAIRQIAPSKPWRTTTEREECCLVLLRGTCTIEYSHGGKTETATLGPRANVFAAYPHAIYLPPRIVRPEACGFEVRGGRNATRQIVDIMPPRRLDAPEPGFQRVSRHD